MVSQRTTGTRRRWCIVRELTPRDEPFYVLNQVRLLQVRQAREVIAPFVGFTDDTEPLTESTFVGPLEAIKSMRSSHIL